MLEIRLLNILHTCIGCICGIASSSITTLTFIAEIRTVIGIWTTTFSTIIVTFKVVCDIITKTIANQKVKIRGAACSICLIVPYGNMGCQVSKRGIQNYIDFWLKINIRIGNPFQLSKCAKIRLFKTIFMSKMI